MDGETAVEQLLPLDVPERVVTFGTKHKTTHFFRRIKASDCEGFSSRVEVELEQKDGKTARVINTQTASLWLYRAAIIRVEGYRLDGDRPITDLPNWKERVPPEHAVRAVNLLTSISFNRPELGCVLYSDGELVLVEALWSAVESENVTGMKRFSGLKHYFASPSSDQHRRFTRAQGKTLAVGDRRFGRTIIPTSQPLLTQLYDELIQRVEGYSVSGRELQGRDEIVREMDPFHKLAAARGLFETGIDSEQEETIEQ